jgi:hypothetical protein
MQLPYLLGSDDLKRDASSAESFAETSSFCNDMPGGACCLVYDLDRGGLGYVIFS